MIRSVIRFSLLLGLLQTSMNVRAFADGSRWELKPKQSNVLFSRDDSGVARRANSSAVLLTEAADRLIGIDHNTVFAYALEQKTVLWKLDVEEPLDLAWMNIEKWILVSTRSHYLLIDSTNGNTLYHSNHFDRLLIRSVGQSKSLVAVESYGISSGALGLRFISFSEEGSYFDAYEEKYLDGTIWLRDVAIDSISGRVYVMASSVENNLIQDAWLRAFDLKFDEGTQIISSVEETEIKVELDGGANRIVAHEGRLAIGGDIHSKKLWYYNKAVGRIELTEFTAGASNLHLDSKNNLLFANGNEQSYNRSALSDLLIFDLEKGSVLRKLRVPAFGPVRLSRFTTSFSVAKNKIALSLVDSAASFSGSEHEPIVPAIVVLEFPN